MYGSLKVTVTHTALTLLILCMWAVSVEGRLRCYNCTYVEYTHKETWGGLDECQATMFDKDKVPVITCDGKCVTRSVWGDVVVTQRTCHGAGEGMCTRIDRYDFGQDGYLSQVCCGESRCNHGGNDGAARLGCSLAVLFATEVFTAVLLLWPATVPDGPCLR